MKKIIICTSLLFTTIFFSVQAAPRYWISNIAGNWNNAANWSATSGGVGGASVPSAADDAIFDATGIGNCNIDVSVVVTGVNVTVGYTGTITQNNFTINVGTGNTFFSGGIFQGGNADFTCNGNFTLNGAIFTAPSASLTIRGDYTFSSGTFNPNSGMVTFSGTNATISGIGHTFNNLTFIRGTYNLNVDITTAGTLRYNGTSTISVNTSNNSKLFVHGDIEISNTSPFAAGNSTVHIEGTGNQTITSTVAIDLGNLPNITINKASGNLIVDGIVSVRGTWTYMSGTITGTGVIAFTNGNVLQGSPHTIPFVTFISGTYNLDVDITITGILRYSGTGVININTASNNKLFVHGDIEISNTSPFGGGNSTVHIEGTGNQTITSTVALGRGALPNVILNKASGDLVVDGIVSVAGTWTYMSGSITGTGMIAFTNGNLLQGPAHTIPSVAFSSGMYNLTTNINVTNNLKITGSANVLLNSGNSSNIYVTGDITVDNTATNGGGNATVYITGSGNTNFNASSPCGSGKLPNVIFDKPGGSMTIVQQAINGAMSIAGTYTYVQGTLTGGTPCNFNIGASITHVSCNGLNDGAIDITVSGGTSPYTFDWGFATTEDVQNLPAGTYSVTVTDADNFTSIETFTVNEPTSLTFPSINLTNEMCAGNCTGSIMSNSTGGTGMKQFSIDGGVTFQPNGHFSGLCSGVYNIEVRDANGCSTVSPPVTFEDVYATPQVSFGTNPSCLDSIFCGVEIIPTVTGGQSPYQYTWSNGAMTDTLEICVHGIYFLTVVDNNGCFTQADYNVVPVSLNTDITLTPPSCSNSDGVVEIIASGGQTPYEYSLDGNVFQPDNIFDNLPESNYTVYVRDANGCVTDTSFILTTVSIAVDTIIKADCILPTGSITVSAISGTAPYTFAWSNGTSGAINDILAAGWYSVTVEDADGCRRHRNIEVPYHDTCRSLISGNVFIDLNGNCVRDVGEPAVNQFMIDYQPGGAVFTNAQGNYSFSVFPGNYTITPVLSGYLGLSSSCLPSGNISVTADGINDFPNNNFALEYLPYEDAGVTMSHFNARPGFIHKVYAHVMNYSTMPVSGVLKFKLDNRTTYSHPSSATDSVNGQEVYFHYNFPSGTINTTKTFSLYAYIAAPPTVNIGDTLYHEAIIIPDGNDAVITNNYVLYPVPVTGAYDPNDKLVTPAGDFLENDSVFLYTVRFQNTGNDTAFTVVIRDTLDENLNVKSIIPVAASHDYEVSVEEDNILIFTFFNILLPDSFVNEPESHGFVQFYITRKPNLPIGTTIANTAAIYFDYNEPIITNTVVNTLTLPVGINNQELAISNQILVYPNPANNLVHFVPKNKQVALRKIELFDLSGRTMLIAEKENSINISRLSQGMYIYRVQDEDGIMYQGKISKE